MANFFVVFSLCLRLSVLIFCVSSISSLDAYFWIIFILSMFPTSSFSVWEFMFYLFVFIKLLLFITTLAHQN